MQEYLLEMVETKIKPIIAAFELDPDSTWVECLSSFHELRHAVKRLTVEQQIRSLIDLQRALLEEVKTDAFVYNVVAITEYNQIVKKTIRQSLTEREIQDLMLLLHSDNDEVLEELFVHCCVFEAANFSSFRDWFLSCFSLFINRLILSNQNFYYDN